MLIYIEIICTRIHKEYTGIDTIMNTHKNTHKNTREIHKRMNGRFRSPISVSIKGSRPYLAKSYRGL